MESVQAEQDPAVRLINLVVALRESKHGLTKQAVFAKIQGYAAGPAGDKMFDRDKTLLREMGLGLRTLPEAGFAGSERYTIDPDGYDMAPVDFTAEEGAILALAARAWRGGGLDETAQAALTKLRALGVEGGSGSVDLNLDPAGHVTGQLWQAIQTRQAVAFDYRTASTGQIKRRQVEPWRLMRRTTGWYLTGYDRSAGARRTFKLDRLAGPVTAQGPPGSFAAVRAGAIDDLPGQAGPDGLPASPSQARVFVSAEAARLLKLKGAAIRPLKQPAPHPGDAPGAGLVAEAVWQVDDLVAASRELAALAPAAKVESPTELAQMVEQLCRAAFNRHQGKPKEISRSIASPKPPRSRRVDSTSQRVGEMLALVNYLANRGQVSLDELGRHFDQSPEEIRSWLYLLWTCTGRPGLAGGDMVDFHFNEDETEVALQDAQLLDQPVRLTTTEAAVLMATLRGWLKARNLPQAEAAKSALAKLEAAFEAAGLGLDVEVPWAPPASDVLATARAAIVDGRALAIDYVDGQGRASHRQVDPLRLFADQNHWLLAAWDRTADDERYFRLDRIVKARQLKKASRSHDPGTGNQAGGFSGTGQYLADVVFDSPVRWRAEALERSGSDVELDAGALLVRLNVASEAWLSGLALALGGQVEVLTPSVLRQAVAERAGLGLDQ